MRREKSYRNKKNNRNKNHSKATVLSLVAFLCVAICLPFLLEVYNQLQGGTTTHTGNPISGEKEDRRVDDINSEYFDFETNQSLTRDDLDRQNYILIQGEEKPPEQKPKNAKEIKTVTYDYQQSNVYIPTTGEGLIKNATDLSKTDIEKIISEKSDLKIDKNSDKPQVLLYHTHTSESYEKFDLGYYDPSADTRTFDESRNVIAVGNSIATQLNNAGINTLHDTTIHDKQYTGAYDVSRKTVQQILKENPSIKVVLDIHRDAVQDESGIRYKPTAEIAEKKAAQVMIIAGCDGYGVNLKNYKDNLKFANTLQDKMESMYPSLTRPVLFDYRHYNQDLGKAALLLEMGGHANTLSEAVYSGELVGNALVSALSE